MWTRQFILFHGQRQPRELGAAEVQAFLDHLGAERAGKPAKLRALIMDRA